MAVEIEIKAWVDDTEALERRVDKIADFVGTEIKEDIYYHFYPLNKPGHGRSKVETQGEDETEAQDEDEDVPNNEKPLAFRLRKSGETSILTWKKKFVSEDMEQNIEREFTLSDYETAKDFIAYLGAWEFIRKRKRCRVYKKGELQIELNHVVSLGDFIEIEKIVPDTKTEEIEQARRDVRSLLEELGIESEKIEKRFYTDLLQEVSHGNT